MNVELTYVVLAEYTDEAIDERTAGREDARADAWRQLRTVPAVWRRSVWAAAHHMAFQLQTDYRCVESGHVARSYHVATGVDLNDAIHTKVAAFHAGWRPRRLESVLAADASTRTRAGE